jgi:hypothetical protein
MISYGFPIALALAAIVTMAAMIFLLINGRSVIRLFVGRREAGPKVRDARTWRTPDAQVRLALGAFIVGTLACLAIYTGAIAAV